MKLSAFSFGDALATKCVIAGVIMLPSLCLADASPFYIGADVTNAGKTNSEVSDTAFGGQILLGYDLSKTWSVEASTGFYGHIKTMKEPDLPYSEVEEQRFNSTDISLLGTIPLSHHYNLYAGAGSLLEGNTWSPISQLGLEYEFDEHLTMKFGYKFIFSDDPEKDLQVLSVGMRYHFPTQNESVPEPVVYDDISVSSTSEMTVYEPKLEPQICASIRYVVKQDDWLMKIAREHQISFEDFKQLNQGFNDLTDINLIYTGDVVLIPNTHCE
ncbi:outer membrane beta-barrel protein [Vibrio crassostreae]|uniref:outer membrane beta-barrel protein n=1 Tax=Vibrio crassostreae TaxID=246167 RepID=UPI00104E0A76|nr:outer membrane beta-barrel protein [Vibrio crassostreae]TCO00251.1 LysM repeat protein [Vibrio crassostreae]CAK2120380.1 LysM repeat protein [Vibrio crassostreae]CAK2123759.1 LysM repeat protein [Vibrio crassostreae]CAK2133528.1 LysM repeat protein [Vibrio crassostreae]CAK2971100.1 LysM repeat protein [Vibrio crassostreae]